MELHGFLSPEQPRAAQSSPEQPRAPQSCPEQPRAAQSSPERPRAAQSSPEQPRAARGSPEQPRAAKIHCTLSPGLEKWYKIHCILSPDLENCFTGPWKVSHNTLYLYCTLNVPLLYPLKNAVKYTVSFHRALKSVVKIHCTPVKIHCALSPDIENCQRIQCILHHFSNKLIGYDEKLQQFSRPGERIQCIFTSLFKALLKNVWWYWQDAMCFATL